MPPNEEFDPDKDVIPDDEFDPAKDVIRGPGAEGFRIPDAADDADVVDVRPVRRSAQFSPAQSAMAGVGAGGSLGWVSKVHGAMDAVGAKGKQALQYVGAMDPDPHVSDAIDSPGVTINGKSVIPAQHVADSGPMPAPTIGEAYSKGEESSRDAYAFAQAQNPRTFNLAEVGGGMLVPLPGAGKLKGIKAVGKAALTGAGIGTASALGHAHGDAAETGIDALVGAGLGGVLGGAGEGLAQAGAGASKVVRDYVLKKMAAAKGDAAAKAAAAVEKEIASKLGAYRSSVQAASRDSEVIGREAASGADDVVAKEAKDFLDSQAAQDLRQQIVSNKLESAPTRLSEMARLKADYEAAKAAQASAVAGKTTDLLSNPLKKQIWPRLLKYSGRVIPPAVGAVAGQWLGGGVAGAAGGALLGGIASATLGAPTTALANAVQHPSVRLAGWQLVEKTLAQAPEKLGKFASYFSKGANPAVTFYVLSQRDPEFRDQMAQLESEPEAQQ